MFDQYRVWVGLGKGVIKQILNWFSGWCVVIVN